MLNSCEAMAVLPAKDLKRAREFYRDVLGLEPAEENEAGLTYRTTAGSGFFLYETDNAGSAKNTQVSWTTDNLEKEMAELRGRGVVFADFDFPGLKTENGIAELGGERTAWFTDSEGNIHALGQRA
ncbi:VOC family protein [Leifsonia kafniensis]|uniref:VOC family protein n=1 Tax=Leifsonia kafniensis TaxID=475957 RepID=A0ABP7L402_9MICO